MDTIPSQHEKGGLFVNMIAIVIELGKGPKNTMFNLELWHWPWTDIGHLIILDMCAELFFNHIWGSKYIEWTHEFDLKISPWPSSDLSQTCACTSSHGTVHLYKISQTLSYRADT